MVPDGRRALHSDSRLACDLRRFDIEIVEHFDVIAQKTDRHDYRCLRVQAPKRILDVGVEPRLARTPAAALVGELPAADSKLCRDHPRRLRKLLDVRPGLRHRERNTCLLYTSDA